MGIQPNRCIVTIPAAMIFRVIPIVSGQRLAYILVRQVYDGCCLQTSVILPQWIKSVERSLGAFLTALGQS
jgi:hypothetical protein